jgi:PAS domain S-box-containing protein
MTKNAGSSDFPGRRRHRAAGVRNILITYLVIGLLWIVFSEEVIALFIPESHQVLGHIVRGAVFVVISAAALYWGYRRDTKALRLSRAYYRGIVEQSIAGIYLIQDGRFRYVNPVFGEIFGYTTDEILQMPVEALVAPEDRERVMTNLRRRTDGAVRTIQYAFTGVRKDGSPLAVEVHGSRVEHEGRPAVLGLLIDVTEKRKVEALYARAERLEALGRLAGGVAHDFNNLLTAIAGSASLLLNGPLDPAERLELEEILKTTERGASLTKQLLVFGRGGPGPSRTVDLNAVIAEAMNLVRRLLDSRIRLTSNLSSRALPVRVDPHQIEQVIVNLVVNAQDAMPDGGTLTIATDLVPGAPASETMRLHDGSPLVTLAVSDTGTGIPPEIQHKIFEPFFTTKAARGTGLGLSTVHGIAEQSGGKVTVESTVGVGTTFTLSLPMSRDEVQPLERNGWDEGGQAANRKLSVLVVEDQKAILRLVRRVLELDGHHVLDAADAESAQAQAAKALPEIDLLLVDDGLPGQSGSALAHDLRLRRPDLPVLLMSGYSPDRFHLEHASFLEKPFTPNELTRRVYEAVGRRQMNGASAPRTG